MNQPSNVSTLFLWWICINVEGRYYNIILYQHMYSQIAVWHTCIIRTCNFDSRHIYMRRRPSFSIISARNIRYSSAGIQGGGRVEGKTPSIRYTSIEVRCAGCQSSMLRYFEISKKSMRYPTLFIGERASQRVPGGIVVVGSTWLYGTPCCCTCRIPGTVSIRRQLLAP